MPDSGSSKTLYHKRIPYSKKLKNDMEWAKETAKFFRSWYGQEFGSRPTSGRTAPSRHTRMKNAYRLYAGDMGVFDFDSDLNPLGSKVGAKSEDIKPYNRTHTKVDEILGEEYRRPDAYNPYVISQSGALALKKKKDELMKKFLQVQFVKEFKKVQIENSELKPLEKKQQLQSLEESYKDVLNPEQIKTSLEKELQAPLEVVMADAYDFIKVDSQLQDKKNDSYRHGLLSGEEHTWVGEVNGKPDFKVLNPLGVFYHKSPDVKFVQNGDYAGYMTTMTTMEVLQSFGSRIKAKKDLDKLQSSITYGDGSDGASRKMEHHRYNRELDYYGAINKDDGSYGKAYYSDWDVFHCEWKSEFKVGFFTYLTEEGVEDMQLVDEYFVFDENDPSHINVEWDWIPERWETTIIGEGIYVDVRPVPWQKINIVDPWKCELSYKGVVYNGVNGEPVSFMERMMPFQYLYSVVVHKMKNLLARDRGTVTDIDLAMVDPRMKLDKTIYYLDNHQVRVYNSLMNQEKPGGKAARPAMSNQNLSNAAQIVNYLRVMDHIESLLGTSAGISASREGSEGQYASATLAQQNITQAAYVTESAYFRPHEVHWGHVINSLLDIAIDKWNEEGFVKSFYTPEGKRKSLKVAKGEFDNADYGLYYTNQADQVMLMDNLKQLTHAIIQNDKARMSDIVSILKGTSAEDIIRRLELYEDKMSTQEQQIAAQAQQSKEAMVQAEIQDREDRQAHEIEKIHTEKGWDYDIALDRSATVASGFEEDKDRNDNGVPDYEETAERLRKETLERRKVALQEKKLDFQKKQLSQKQKEKS